MDFRTVKDLLIEDDVLRELTGVNDRNTQYLEELYDGTILFRDNIVRYSIKENYDLFERHIRYLVSQIRNNQSIDGSFIKQSYLYLKENPENNKNWQSMILGYSHSGKPMKCKTFRQYNLIKMIDEKEMVFSVGPAGTGKTFLSVLMAVKALKSGEVKKIILTRPAVEAGENLGFLPGDLKDKIDPYLMPLYDALEYCLGGEQLQALMEKNTIEIIPLAYMRGRTLNEAFVILDEAQNTTASQMLMFLTRLGFKSKMVINGDVTQIDLKLNKNQSGLVLALNKLKNIDKIGFIEFSSDDVVRNPLVQIIVENFKI